MKKETKTDRAKRWTQDLGIKPIKKPRVRQKQQKRIELTPKQIEVIEKQLRGAINIGTEGEDRTLMTEVIEKAEKLYLELKEDLDGDLIKWFYGKYKEQENE